MAKQVQPAVPRVLLVVLVVPVAPVVPQVVPVVRRVVRQVRLVVRQVRVVQAEPPRVLPTLRTSRTDRHETLSIKTETSRKSGDVVGLLPTGAFPDDLQVPFRQGSFPIGVPKFGGFQPDAGLQVGMAILSDIETFFLINAAQGDERNNLMFSPKVTLFNGQQATVQDTVQRPFVTSLVPTVGFFSIGYQPRVPPCSLRA